MKTLIAVPCTDYEPIKFADCLMNLRKPEHCGYAQYANSMVHESRNKFALIGIDPEQHYDRVLWIDSDMVFEPDMLERLSADMDEYHLDYVSGICFKRRLPTEPCVYESLTYEKVAEHNGIDIMAAKAVTMRDYPRDQLFQVAASGFGAVLTTTELLNAVVEAFGQPFQPLPQMGEDLSFCYRVAQLGRTMWCDSRVKVGHIGQHVYCEADYLEQVAKQNGNT